MLPLIVVALALSNSLACACALPYAALLAARPRTQKKSDPRDLTVIPAFPTRMTGEAWGRTDDTACFKKEGIHELSSAA
jgi:hypothetical protein